MSEQDEGRAHWPPGVKPISWEATGLLGVGADKVLYWDGKPVEVRRRLDLTQGQAALAWIVGISTAIGAVATAVQAWVAVRGPA